ncbi:MAG: hypothetical protein HC859_02745 [Bacteroidia bacterium]|nr:hypothetical protein [Bacteroidia bacterium]
MARKDSKPTVDTLGDFLKDKSPYAIDLFDHFVAQLQRIGPVDVLPAKSMIGIATQRKRILYVTQFGKGFIHVVFPFKHAHTDNLCFQKIAQVPGDVKQFNHHFRMLAKTDVNAEVKKFMRMAYEEGS